MVIPIDILDVVLDFE